MPNVMNITEIRVEDRVLEFAGQHLYGGRRPDSLLKRLGLTYRKGKTEKDIFHVKQLCFNRPNSGLDLVDDFAIRLEKILKSC